MMTAPYWSSFTKGMVLVAIKAEALVAELESDSTTYHWDPSVLSHERLCLHIGS